MGVVRARRKSQDAFNWQPGQDCSARLHGAWRALNLRRSVSPVTGQTQELLSLHFGLSSGGPPEAISCVFVIFVDRGHGVPPYSAGALLVSQPPICLQLLRWSPPHAPLALRIASQIAAYVRFNAAILLSHAVRDRAARDGGRREAARLCQASLGWQPAPDAGWEFRQKYARVCARVMGLMAIGVLGGFWSKRR
jgi:hypothetical protein